MSESAGSANHRWKVASGVLVAPLVPGAMVGLLIALGMVVHIPPRELVPILIIGFFSFPIVAGLCYLPALLVALPAVGLLHLLRWRSRRAHEMTGLVLGALVGLGLARTPPFDTEARDLLALCGCALAGILSGTTYWALALHGVPPPSRPPPPPE